MKDKILVVDDTKILRKMMERLLRHKYEVKTASSYEEALSILKESCLAENLRFQTVITDIGLSSDSTNTDGIDLLKDVHQLSPTTTTIAVSGRPAVVDTVKFAEEYHALVFLPRSVLVKDQDTFMAWVDKGVALSHANQGSY